MARARGMPCLGGRLPLKLAALASWASGAPMGMVGELLLLLRSCYHCGAARLAVPQVVGLLITEGEGQGHTEILHRAAPI